MHQASHSRQSTNQSQLNHVNSRNNIQLHKSMSTQSMMKSTRRIVTAREKSTQTPLSYLSAKETKVFIDRRHQELVQD